jgi:hypothetical protein
MDRPRRSGGIAVVEVVVVEVVVVVVVPCVRSQRSKCVSVGYIKLAARTIGRRFERVAPALRSCTFAQYASFPATWGRVWVILQSTVLAWLLGARARGF